VKRIACILCLIVAVASAGEDPLGASTLYISRFQGAPEFHPPGTNLEILRVNYGTEVVSIRSTGRLFWNGREVKTDADFRAAMMIVMKGVNTKCTP
jgi:hypothetical protein